MKRQSIERSASVRLTERDAEIVRLICEQGVADARDLGTFMARCRGRARIGERTRNGVLARLVRVGLIEADRFLAARPALIFPTRLGARWVQWDGLCRRPPLALLRHEMTAAAVRVAAYPAQLGWTYQSERTILAKAIECGQHRPDGIAALGGLRTAVEVQLSVTDVKRTASVIDSHLAVFDRVHYWAVPAAASVVDRAIEVSLPISDRSRVQVTLVEGLER